MSHDPILVLSVYAINVKVKFTPLRSHVYVVQSLFRPLLVSVLKASTILTVNIGLPPNFFSVVSKEVGMSI